MNRFSLWIGLGIGALALYMAVRGVEWGSFTQVLMRAHWQDLILALGSILLALAFMTLRWQLVIARPGVSYKVAWVSLFAALMVNNILPGRLGEILRPLLVAHQSGLAHGFLFARALVDRILDIALLGALGILIVFLMPTLPLIRQTAVVGVIVLGCVIAGLFTIRSSVFHNFWKRLEGRYVPDQIRANIIQLREEFHLGLRNISPATGWPILVGLTVSLWGMIGVSLHLTLQAFSLSVPLWGIVLLGVLLNFGALIPALPGQVGTYQFIAVTVLEVFGISREAALSFALAHHMLWYLPTTLGGFLALGQQVSLRHMVVLAKGQARDKEVSYR